MNRVLARPMTRFFHSYRRDSQCFAYQSANYWSKNAWLGHYCLIEHAEFVQMKNTYFSDGLGKD